MNIHSLPNSVVNRDKLSVETLDAHCPYLQNRSQSIPSAEGALTFINEAKQPGCYALSEPFVPTAVQQSSCCLNIANFTRCSYYYAAASAQQIRRHNHYSSSPSMLAKLRDLIMQFLPRSNRRKKYKRVYYIS